MRIIISLELALVLLTGPIAAKNDFTDDLLYYQTKKAQRAELLYKAGFISATIGLFLCFSPDESYVPAGIPIAGNIMYPAGWSAMMVSLYWQRSIAFDVTGQDLAVPKYTWLSLAGGFLVMGSAVALKANDHPNWSLIVGAGGLACHVFSYFKVSETKHTANKRIWDKALGRDVP